MAFVNGALLLSRWVCGMETIHLFWDWVWRHLMRFNVIRTVLLLLCLRTFKYTMIISLEFEKGDVITFHLNSENRASSFFCGCVFCRYENSSHIHTHPSPMLNSFRIKAQ